MLKTLDFHLDENRTVIKTNIKRRMGGGGGGGGGGIAIFPVMGCLP